MKIYNNENPKVFIEIGIDSKSPEARSITLEVGQEAEGLGVELSRSKAVDLLGVLAHIRKEGNPSNHRFWPEGERDQPNLYIQISNYPGPYALSIAIWEDHQRESTRLTEAQADLLDEELRNLISQMPYVPLPPPHTRKNTIDAQRGETIALGVTDFDPGGNNPSTLDLIFGSTQRFAYTISLNKRQTKDLSDTLLKLIDQMGEKES